MFIPLGTDQLPKRRIIATPILIGLNLAVFVVVLMLARFGVAPEEGSPPFGSVGRNHFLPWGLITYQFLHSGILHIVGNMVFLWVFGQAVESRLGAIGFTIFYLAGGVIAGLAHMLASPDPVVGASGAVSAVSGAFLILFPRATIKALSLFIIIGIFHIPAVWFIGFYIAFNVLNQFSAFFGSDSQTSFAAHLGGYFFGAAVAALLLATKILPRTDLDMVYLFKQSRRRKAMRQAVAKSPAVWDTAAAGRSAKTALRSNAPAPPPDPHAEAKHEIATHLRNHDGEAALACYRTLRETGTKVLLPEEHQVDLANRLLAAGDYEESAEAYQLLLKKRGKRQTGAGVSSNEIRLLLASLLVRRLGRAKEAKPILDALNDSILDTATKGLRDTLREEIKAAT